MKKPESGGQAFPQLDERGFGQEGMYLRDYFAGQALMGIISSPKNHFINNNEVIEPKAHAEMVYLYADAMIVQKRRGHKK